MKITTNIPTLFLSICLAFLAACNSSEYQTTEDGLQFSYLKRGEGSLLPEPGQIVFCHYAIYTEKDTLIFSTYSQRKTEDRIEIQESVHKGDIFSALRMMSEGDSMAFLLSADSFYLVFKGEEKLPNFIKPGESLRFVIKMEKILNRSDYEALKNRERYQQLVAEVADIDAYFKEKNWEDRKLEEGVRYYITHATEGKKVKWGDKVEFHYIGKVMKTGAEFVNSYVLGKKASMVVGNEEVKPEILNLLLLQLKEGERATFAIPFDYAFGEKGVTNLIPPYATVIYEINVTKINQD
jgi:FKBP-type peptidyl-prolyl cis-trans isomerase FkpA